MVDVTENTEVGNSYQGCVASSLPRSRYISSSTNWSGTFRPQTAGLLSLGWTCSGPCLKAHPVLEIIHQQYSERSLVCGYLRDMRLPKLWPSMKPGVKAGNGE